MMSISNISCKVDLKVKLMNDFGFRVLGFIMIISGISIWFNPTFFSSKFQMTFDYTEVRLPMCLFLIIVGGLFVWTTFRRRK